MQIKSARIKLNSLDLCSFTYSSSVWISSESTLMSSVTSSSDEISSSYQPSSESGMRLESSDPPSFFEYARMNPCWMESREILFTASWNLFWRSLSPHENLPVEAIVLILSDIKRPVHWNQTCVLVEFQPLCQLHNHSECHPTCLLVHLKKRPCTQNHSKRYYNLDMFTIIYLEIQNTGRELAKSDHLWHFR